MTWYPFYDQYKLIVKLRSDSERIQFAAAMRALYCALYNYGPRDEDPTEIFNIMLAGFEFTLIKYYVQENLANYMEDAEIDAFIAEERNLDMYYYFSGWYRDNGTAIITNNNDLASDEEMERLANEYWKYAPFNLLRYSNWGCDGNPMIEEYMEMRIVRSGEPENNENICVVEDDAPYAQYCPTY